MKKYCWMSLIFLGFLQISVAQQASDAIRYSYLNPTGTARWLGSGGAFTSLGADFASASANPAGIGMYRESEFSFTPALRFAHTDAVIRGQNISQFDSKSNFNIGNVGLVFVTEPRSKHWKAVNLGIGMNRLANFNQAIFYEGKHPGSIMNGYFKEAKTVNADQLDPFGAKLAWDANAIYTQNNVLTYDFEGVENAPITHAQSILISGGMNELAFAFGANYEDKLMVGGSIGVPILNYQLETTYDETDPDDLVPYFDKLTRTEFLRTNGIGFVGKMGVIYKASQAVRIGMSFHTPTFLSLTDNFENTFNYTYTDGSGQKSSGEKYSPNGTFDYKLRTPWRTSVGASYVFWKFNYLTADVEWVDYKSNQFNLTSNVSSNENQSFERELNQQIRRNYRSAANIRLGTQFRFDKFLLRGGLALLGKYQQGETGFNKSYSLGAGVRAERFYVELGFRHNTGTSTVSPYFDPQMPQNQQLTVDANMIVNDFLLTVGFKF